MECMTMTATRQTLVGMVEPVATVGQVVSIECVPFITGINQATLSTVEEVVGRNRAIA